MSNLSDKITSYTHERGIELNEAFSVNPTRTGTVTPVTNAWTNGNASFPPVYESAVGPAFGSGSWKFQYSSTAASNTRFTITGTNFTNELPGLTDGDYTVGFWIKLSKYPTVSSVSLMSFGNSGSSGVLINYNGSTNPTSANRGKISIGTAGGLATTFSSVNITDTDYHYVAVRRVTSPSITYYLYVDGQQVASASGTSTSAPTSLTIGSASTQTDNYNINFSNIHFSTSSQIDAAAIAEIWTAGTTSGATDITITETPATASALQTEPTIAIVANDHVEITTSILVSADFPSNIVAGGDKNINNEITGTLDASIEMINNVDISTGSDISFSALEMTATATLPESVLPVQPLTASATSGNHSVYVTPNYYSLVRASNPYAYFYDGQGSSSINGGYQSGTFARGTGVTTNSDAGVPLNLVGNGKSWQLAPSSGADNYLDFTVASATDAFAQHIENGECSVELFYKPSTYPASNYGYWTIFETEGLEIRTRASNIYSEWSSGSRGALEIVYKQGTTALSTYTSNYGYLNLNNTHHIVVTITAATAGQVQITGWVDGSVVISATRAKTSWTVADTSVRFGSSGGYNNVGGMGDGWFDEVALYSQKLSNSEVITHYSFVDSQSPNRNIAAEPLYADADSGDNNFLVTSNVNIPDTAVTASAIVLDPIVIASRVIEFAATPLTASAANTDVIVKRGWTIYATPVTAYAEAINAYRLNTTYSQYVQTNVNPYRYVTFDGNNSYADYGTDNDYAVTPVAVGGTIVNPDEGINGKSAKTAGTSYITDGVILKESEYDDNWGTGLNNYHSSFWIQKAPEDSSTGLRVIWNLNGYADNQHVILYQYQGKLHLNFNNGSGTHIDQATVANYDLFDGERHFVGVAFDHTGVNSYVNLFIDAIDVMTVNLGTYNGTTINGTTPVGANDEENNHPRVSVGCLITPFASTALPVIPTNTRIYADEIVWTKTSLTQTLATNLFNTMPVKGLVLISADPMTASTQINEPTIITNSILASETMTADAEILESTLYVELESVNSADIIDVSAELVMPAIFENVTIVSDIFAANAAFNDAGTLITVGGGPLIASVTLPEYGIKVNGVFIRLAYTAYTNYLIKDSSAAAITRFREVK